MKKCFLSIIIIICSCTLIKHKIKTANRESSVVLTNSQQTDSILKFSKQIEDIFKGFVFVDSTFFIIKPDGTLTFRDSLTFNIGVFKKLYVGIPIDTSHDHSGVDTLIISD